MHRLIAAVLLLGSCDPEGPGASGTITLDSAIDTSAYDVLVMMTGPDPDGTYSVDDLAHLDMIGTQVPLSDIEFPYDYSLGMGVGTTDEPQWRTTVWLASSDDTTTPTDDAPWASAPFVIDDCGSFGGYCGVTEGVDLELHPLLQE